MFNTSSTSNSLNYDDVYSCPVCRHGEISNLTLMDAYACNFCNHIFTANLEQQTIKMAGSQLGLTWRWTGRKWQGINRDGIRLSWTYWLAGIIFILLPTILISMAVYCFPPLPGSPLAWLPIFWVFLTFVAHSLCLAWLIVEYYQFPIFRYIAIISRRILS